MKSLAIEREYGTDGWGIGKRIAEKKGIPFYDEKGIIAKAEKMGCRLTLLKNYEEKKKESILYNIAMIAKQETELKIEVEKMIQELFSELKETVETLYMKEPAVFVGGAVCGMVGNTDCFVKVFLRSSRKDKKIVYLQQDRGMIGNAEMKRSVNNRDKQREIYFRMLTQKDWKDTGNYNFVYDIFQTDKDTIIDNICTEMDK